MICLTDAEALQEELFPIREKLHRHPETGHQEFQTTETIRTYLSSVPGVEVLDYGLSSGVAARIQGGGLKAAGRRLLALREDMDALPMTEDTGLPFASETAGICHACGHDIHTTVLLGCAKLLAARRETLCGDVLLLFQPAEETFDGAASMLEQDIFRDGVPDAVVGLHCAPNVPLGKVGILPGIVNASCDMITLTVSGRGGHGAHPEDCVDPVITGAGLLMQLETALTRRIGAQKPVVLTFGEFHAGTAPNIIPCTAVLRGNLRTMDNDTRHQVLEMVREVSQGYCRSMGAECDVVIDRGMPPLVNDPVICGILSEVSRDLLGKCACFQGISPSMGSDDISLLIEAAGGTGAQFLLGTHDYKRPATGLGLHVARNVFPSEAISGGAAVLAEFSMRYLAG